ncbi:hypothetical protein [Amycolatopsis sp. DG1A-15b]|uniref:hypothetical protein n=1 Tax=Amycolatopsis sp. DG1A-15b TaxID=3052846 RepID=UPI00255BE22B|nr:hypothetical protein [Amycolatopsis sp. DG1A-15b]WIX85810.1 hypothetical protein QRY02_31985 [Amycolatopsis sp. DG1A-15b]
MPADGVEDCTITDVETRWGRTVARASEDGSSHAGDDAPIAAPSADLRSPIPRRRAADQEKLTVALLNLDTFAERLTYLFDHASTYYLLRGDPVVDPDAIDRLTADGDPTFLTFTARPPLIAQWVRDRTGLPLAEQALRNFKAGIRQNSRPAITRALAEFWRIHPNLLDPSVPATDFAPPDDEIARKTHELVTELGLVGFNARDITSSIGDAPDADRKQLLQVVEEIARARRAARDNPAS